MRIAKVGWITERILLLGREESNVYLLKGEEPCKSTKVV